MKAHGTKLPPLPPPLPKDPPNKPSKGANKKSSRTTNLGTSHPPPPPPPHAAPAKSSSLVPGNRSKSKSDGSGSPSELISSSSGKSPQLNPKSNTERNYASSKTKSSRAASLQAIASSEPAVYTSVYNLPVAQPNCRSGFYCGGECAGTPSSPRYPAGHFDSKRKRLGPEFGKNIPKGLGEPCRRCGRPVFLAELHLGYHGAYHTECFKCCACGKKLDSTTVAEHQGEIFCKGCYRRNFGQHGCGFGVGAGTLQTP